MPKSVVTVGLLTVALFGSIPVALAQTDRLPPVRTISVDGRSMRIMTAGLEQRKAGQPVVILEAGAGEPGVSPLDRAFFDQYPQEVAGLLFIDAANGADPTREEKAAVLPPERRSEALAPPVLPPFPPDIPAGLRAELEEIGREMINDGQESRSLRQVTGVPVAIVVATPPGRMKGDSGAVTRLLIQRALEYVLTVPNGIFVTANVGHNVHDHEPAFVVSLVQHVLNHAVTITGK